MNQGTKLTFNQHLIKGEDTFLQAVITTSMIRGTFSQSYTIISYNSPLLSVSFVTSVWRQPLPAGFTTHDTLLLIATIDCYS